MFIDQNHTQACYQMLFNMLHIKKSLIFGSKIKYPRRSYLNYSLGIKLIKKLKATKVLTKTNL